MTEVLTESAKAKATQEAARESVATVSKLRANPTFVTQSRFFSPLFNAAIFDGPIRIYFAQDQESQALKVYFEVQERYADLRRKTRGLAVVSANGTADSERKNCPHNVFVMIYPNSEVFDLAFGALEAEPAEGTNHIASEPLGEDFVLGVRGPLEDATMKNLLEEMDSILRAAQA